MSGWDTQPSDIATDIAKAVEVTEDLEGPFCGGVEAGKLLGVDERTVSRWSDKGDLPLSHRTAGGHRRYRLADVHALARRLKA